MKRYFSSLLILTVILIAGCDEKDISIPEVVPDSEKKVLIEEFTGVECVNCPQGSAELENLLGLYSENLIAVSIHAGIFSDPYPDSQHDFRTEEGTSIQEYVGNPLGWPSAVVNRHNPSGSSLQLGLNKWAGAIDEALSRDPLASLGGTLEFDRSTRSGRINLRAVALENVRSPIYVTVLVTESHIFDYQLTPMGLDPNYEHKHVLRKVITPSSGERLVDELAIGEVAERTLNFSFDESWVIDNCDIVAFIHFNGASKEVIQAEEFKIPN